MYIFYYIMCGTGHNQESRNTEMKSQFVEAITLVYK